MISANFVRYRSICAVVGIIIAVALTGAAPKPNGDPALCTASDAPCPARLREIDRSFWEKTTTDPIAAYTGVLAVLTGLLALVSIGQVYFLTRADGTARVAANAAAASAKVAKDTLISSQRAFVFPVGFKAFWEIDPVTKKYSWRYRPRWRNSGQTATRRLRMHTECVVLPSPIAAGFDFNYSTTEIGTGVIYPLSETMGGQAPRVPASAVTHQDILDAQTGKKFIYLWGWTRYYDIFDDATEHITRFCWLILPNGNPVKKPEEIHWDWIVHAEGNCCDNDCEC